jgi:hypothetical protein
VRDSVEIRHHKGCGLALEAYFASKGLGRLAVLEYANMWGGCVC